MTVRRVIQSSSFNTKTLRGNISSLTISLFLAKVREILRESPGQKIISIQ